MNAGTVGAVAAAGLLGVMGVSAVVAADSSPQTAAVIPGTTAPGNTYPPGTTLADGYVQGVCAPFLPPDVDPCDAVNGTLRYSVLFAIESNVYYPKWVAANPGEVARLNGIMAAPACSVAPTGQPQVMRTQYGASLAGIMSAIACARHPEPITWPPLPPPPNPNRTDKQAPSAPGPVTVAPNG